MIFAPSAMRRWRARVDNDRRPGRQQRLFESSLLSSGSKTEAEPDLSTSLEPRSVQQSIGSTTRRDRGMGSHRKRDMSTKRLNSRVSPLVSTGLPSFFWTPLNPIPAASLTTEGNHARPFAESQIVDYNAAHSHPRQVADEEHMLPPSPPRTTPAAPSGSALRVQDSLTPCSDSSGWEDFESSTGVYARVDLTSKRRNIGDCDCASVTGGPAPAGDLSVASEPHTPCICDDESVCGVAQRDDDDDDEHLPYIHLPLPEHFVPNLTLEAVHPGQEESEGEQTDGPPLPSILRLTFLAGSPGVKYPEEPHANLMIETWYVEDTHDAPVNGYGTSTKQNHGLSM